MLTFSRKARQELEGRLQAEGCTAATASTFHALANRLLREHGSGNLSIISDEERLQSMMRDILA